MSTAPGPTHANDDDDKTMLFVLAAVFLSLGGAAVIWDKVLTKLLAFHVILPASPEVTIALPKAAGAGLDMNRVLLGGALLMLLLAAAAGERRRKARARERRGDGVRAGRR